MKLYWSALLMLGKLLIHAYRRAHTNMPAEGERFLLLNCFLPGHLEDTSETCSSANVPLSLKLLTLGITIQTLNS